MASKFLVKKTKTGFVFHLKATNGETIATSEVYATNSGAVKGIKSVIQNSQGASIEDTTKEKYEKCTNPKFQIYKDKAGEFRFRLKAKNGKNIVASEGYSSLKSCQNGIASVQKNAPSSAIEMDW